MRGGLGRSQRDCGGVQNRSEFVVPPSLNGEIPPAVGYFQAIGAEMRQPFGLRFQVHRFDDAFVGGEHSCHRREYALTGVRKHLWKTD